MFKYSVFCPGWEAPIMIRKLVLISMLALAAPVTALSQPASLPEAMSGRSAYAPFEAMVGKTWRGQGTGPDKAEDIQRWEWAIGGHAIRIVHSVNNGVYAGESLIFRDKDSGSYIFHYFTTAGFHTTGTIHLTGPAAFEMDEVVHGAKSIEALKSTGVLGADGIYRTRSKVEKDGKWVDVGGFDYREDATAVPVMP
jgi:hypothetical protein